MSISANPPRIICIAFEGLQMLDLIGPADVFSIANTRTKGRYDVLFVGTLKAVTASNGLTINLAELPEIKESDTVIVPGGLAKSIYNAIADKQLMKWLDHAASVAHRTASVCSGAFILANIGLLDGRQSVTHWSAVDHLAKYAPDTEVKKDAIFVEDGKIWTSAGVTTGIDLALALIRRDHGEKAALQVARDIVVQVIRPGNQSQYSVPLSLQNHAGPDLQRLVPWLETRISELTSVAEMAEKMGMSERQFHRQCIAQFGRTPAKLFVELKLDHARNFLQDDKISISTISEVCGFSSTASFSKAFKKQFEISPAMFRKHWSSRN